VARCTILPEIESNNAESRLGQQLCLMLPALFVEPASVCQYNSPLAFPMDQGVNHPAVLSSKRYRLGPTCDASEKEREQASGSVDTSHANESTPFAARGVPSSIVSLIWTPFIWYDRKSR
jgi:hypothetical protein